MADFADRLRTALDAWQGMHRTTDGKSPLPDAPTWERVIHLCELLGDKEVPNHRMPQITTSNNGGVMMELYAHDMEVSLWSTAPEGALEFVVKIHETNQEACGDVSPAAERELLEQAIALMKGDVQTFQWFWQRRDTD